MKQIKVGNIKLSVAEHKGDVAYSRYVMFKKYAPQFFERMDVPTFAIFKEKIFDLFNQGKWMQGVEVLKDYEFSIKNVENRYDAWGICFALIAYEDGEDQWAELNEVQVHEKLARLTTEGVTADVITEGVINFMKACPETFTDHMNLFALQTLTAETVS